MNPLMISYAFLGLTVTALTAWWISPLINAHITMNNESRLYEMARSAIDSNRFNRDQAMRELLDIDLKGLRMENITLRSQGDYDIYELEFNYNNLLYNKFNESHEFRKVINLVIDRSEF